MTKRLFLTSKFHYVAGSLASKMSTSEKQRLVFIDTGIKYRVFKDQELDWHYANLEAMRKHGFVFDLYDISGKSNKELNQDLDEYEAMYVEGGNSAYLQQESQKNNFEAYVKKRLDQGMVYLSESAGSVIAGADIAANSRPGKSFTDYNLSSSAGFGLVNFVILPHWGQASKKDNFMNYKIPQSYQTDFPYILLSNNQYVEVVDDWWSIVDLPAQADITKDTP